MHELGGGGADQPSKLMSMRFVQRHIALLVIVASRQSRERPVRDI